MIKLGELIESVLGPRVFSKTLQNAYSVIFDVDAVKVVKSRDLYPPSHMHKYIATNIEFVYRQRYFFIYHHLYHYKFPPSEFKGMTSAEWDDMLKTVEKFKHVKTKKQDVLGTHPTMSLNANIYTSEKPQKNWFHFVDVGEVKNSQSVGDMVKKVKVIIDKYIDGESDNKEKSPTVPTSPIKKLVPA